MSGGGFGDDAVGAWGADELCDARAVCVLFFEPLIPGVAEFALPEVKGFAEVVFGLVEGASERVVREVDAGVCESF